MIADADDTFDPVAEVAALKAEAKVCRRRKNYRQSKLRRFAGELLAMKEAGASVGDLVRWLNKKRVCIHRSSLYRFIAQEESLAIKSKETRPGNDDNEN